MNSLSSKSRLPGAAVFGIALLMVSTAAASGCGGEDDPFVAPGGSAGSDTAGAGGTGATEDGSAGTGMGGTAGTSSPDAGTGGSAGRGGTAGGSGAAGRGGSAGSGGSGAVSGTGGEDAGGATDCPGCHDECRNSGQEPPDLVANCFQATGTAQDGGAAGQPLSKLCRDLVACIYRTNCAASGLVSDCYCGNGDCATAPNGACKQQVEWAAESEDFVDVVGRFDDPAFALGRAGRLLNCYFSLCPNECTSCGNSKVDPGEPCDPTAPNPDPLCLSTCKRAVCGNSKVENPVEQCEPPNTGTCTDKCKTRTQTCGDGFVTAPEQCDPPNGTTCATNCRFAAAGCGNGIVEQGEFCDPPDGNFYAIPRCGGIWDPALNPPGGSASACRPLEGRDCQLCLDEVPLPGTTTPGACNGLTCEALSGNAQGGPGMGKLKLHLCRELLDCIYDTKCALMGLNTQATNCYCGNAADCSTGANGACKAEFEAAAEATDFATVDARLRDNAFASGIARGRIDCQSINTTANCTGQCEPRGF